jgi:hypothetical protein
MDRSFKADPELKSREDQNAFLRKEDLGERRRRYLELVLRRELARG